MPTAAVEWSTREDSRVFGPAMLHRATTHNPGVGR